MKNIAKYYLIGLAVVSVILVITLYSLPFDGGFQQELGEKESEEKLPRIEAQQNELDLLARAVHAESRGEPYEGQVSVAAVILNRVEHPEFPNTVSGVLYEPLAFSVVADGQINRPADDSASEVARDALYGLDPTNGALYFYNPQKTRNQWIRSRPVIKTIGKHIFTS